MNMIPEQDTPLTAVRSLALSARQKFAGGKRMTVRKSKIVHAVTPARWIGGELIPQPACHTGTYGWDIMAMNATYAPITCQRCIRTLDTAAGVFAFPYGPVQPPLFVLEAA